MTIHLYNNSWLGAMSSWSRWRANSVVETTSLLRSDREAHLGQASGLSVTFARFHCLKYCGLGYGMRNCGGGRRVKGKGETVKRRKGESEADTASREDTGYWRKY